MAELELRDLTKHYRRGEEVIRALDGVTLTFGAGEFVAVVGRSGSGKTTMLDVMGLLLRPTSGTLMLDGIDTGKLNDSARAHLRAHKIGFVFQEYNLLPTLNVLENVLMPLRYTSGTKGGRERAAQLLESMELSNRARHRPSELSGGQQQRVAIARSMINEPSLILLDEPTGAVDTETADQLVALLQRINREQKVTIVVVTHDLDLAAKTGRQIRLKDGKVISDEVAAPVPA
ncbi:MAG TPA: ABC transporter ATP-binding protein [Candidatus Dormibacteraeota bacterium]|nr:ABC transporter ATP-binding protein [Candidatus Dormibacteraeota bacterium]